MSVHRTPPPRRRHWLLAALRVAMSPALLLSVRAVRGGEREDFFKSIELDNVQLLRPLLEGGLDPNTTDERGNPGLLVAVRDGSFEVAELLLSARQIQVDKANSLGETALMMAALRGHADWVGRLLDRGAAINRTGWTPLHYAASGPDPKLVGLLLERGAQLEAPSANGTTALMMAAGYGAMDAADLLLARGADPRRRNQRGLSAADFARRAGRDALAQRLEAPVR
jgi:ankyrin repeat protein